jgi:hypothetical protein
MTDKQTVQVEQALAEKALAEVYGQTENIRAAEKRLESLGYKAAKKRAEVVEKNEAPPSRATRQASQSKS